MNQRAKKTPLYDKHIELGGRMVEFAGYMLPLWYTGRGQGAIREHLAVRRKAGVFDLTHMGEIFFSGEKVFDFLQFVLCNDLRKIGNGGAQYTLLPTEDGGVVDDLIIYQVSPYEFFAVVNAVNIKKDYEWFCRWNEEKSFGVDIVDRSDELALIAVQGPSSEEILMRAGFRNVHCVLPFTFRKLKHDGKRLILSATGYTGERGFELIVENEYAGQLWEKLMASGNELGLKPAGLAARDSLRVEAGFCLYGNELDLSTSVLEANLAWTVEFGKDFVGKDYLISQRKKGLRKKLLGLEIQQKGAIPRKGCWIYDKKKQMKIGEVSSGVYSPVLDRAIALCFIEDMSVADENNEVYVEVRQTKLAGKLVKPPFIKPRLYTP